MLDVTSPKQTQMIQLYLTMAPIGTSLFFFAGYQMNDETLRFRSEVHVFDTSANGGRWTSFEPITEDGTNSHRWTTSTKLASSTSLSTDVISGIFAQFSPQGKSEQSKEIRS
ncbi:hypothetical protein L1887_18343 [Cichorium endivia]|nr:hypothetical protein L1887_18343 [Cichorium endivia]